MRVEIEIRVDGPVRCYVVLWVGVSLDEWRSRKSREELLVKINCYEARTSAGIWDL
ncbi:MAG: hypothetical protein QXI22_04925 [Sulfolobales archaeon]